MSKKQKRIDWRLFKKEVPALVGDSVSIILKRGDAFRGIIHEYKNDQLSVKDHYLVNHTFAINDIEEIIAETKA